MRTPINAPPDRSRDISDSQPALASLQQNGRIEREGREGGEPSQDARRQEEAGVLVSPFASEREQARQHADRETADQVDDQGSRRKAASEHRRASLIDTVSERSAQAGTEEDPKVGQKASHAPMLRRHHPCGKAGQTTRLISV